MAANESYDGPTEVTETLREAGFRILPKYGYLITKGLERKSNPNEIAKILLTRHTESPIEVLERIA